MPMMTNAIVTFFFTTITSTHKFRFLSFKNWKLLVAILFAVKFKNDRFKFN